MTTTPVEDIVFSNVNRHDPEALFRYFGSRGIIVSCCYGPAENRGMCYSVDAMKETESFDKPFQAKNLVHCFEIMFDESIKRGWLTKDNA